MFSWNSAPLSCLYIFFYQTIKNDRKTPELSKTFTITLLNGPNMTTRCLALYNSLMECIVKENVSLPQLVVLRTLDIDTM